MKKIICICLALLLVLSALAACGTDTPPAPVSTGNPADVSGGDTTIADADTTAAETEPPETERMHRVPVAELDFGAEEFHVVAFDWQAYSDYFFAEEDSSDPMESAIYMRKCVVEDALHVTLTHTMYKSYTDMYPAVDQNVGTGDDGIQLILMHCISGVASYATSGVLYPFEKLPHIDLSADWWNQEQMDALRLGRSYHYGVSDYMIPTPNVLLFNKDMIDDLSLENPYTLVDENRWTLDKMEEMSRAASRDVNTDGVWDESDIYGIGGNGYLNFWSACGQFLAHRGEEGKIVFDMSTEKAFDIIETIAVWSREHVSHVPSTGQESDLLKMQSGQVLFAPGSLSPNKKLMESDVNYGILPYPKYNAEQENYRCLDWGGFMAVPTTIRDPEMVGATLELLAFESAETTIPVFYDKVLSGQLAQDPDASRMIDIILENICYDPAMNYLGLSGSVFKIFYAPWFEAHMEGRSNFASLYAEHAEPAQKQIDDLYAALELTETLNDMMG